MHLILEFAFIHDCNYDLQAFEQFSCFSFVVKSTCDVDFEVVTSEDKFDRLIVVVGEVVGWFELIKLDYDTWDEVNCYFAAVGFDDGANFEFVGFNLIYHFYHPCGHILDAA